MIDSGRMALRAAALCFLLLSPCLRAQSKLTLYKDERLGFQFQYPSTFVAGRYQINNSSDMAFKDAIALIERRVLGGRSPQAVPIGDATSITILPHPGKPAEFYQKKFALPKWRARFANVPVFKLPGYPGPVEDKTYFYLVVPSSELAIEWMTTRQYVEDQRALPTRYDAVIEQILATFKSVK